MYLHFLLLYTFTPRYLSQKYCNFYSTTFILIMYITFTILNNIKRNIVKLTNIFVYIIID